MRREAARERRLWVGTLIGAACASAAMWAAEQTSGLPWLLWMAVAGLWMIFTLWLTLQLIDGEGGGRRGRHD